MTGLFFIVIVLCAILLQSLVIIMISVSRSSSSIKSVDVHCTAGLHPNRAQKQTLSNPTWMFVKNVDDDQCVQSVFIVQIDWLITWINLLIRIDKQHIIVIVREKCQQIELYRGKYLIFLCKPLVHKMLSKAIRFFCIKINHFFKMIKWLSSLGC